MHQKSIKVVSIKLFFLTLVVLKHMMVSNSGVTVSGKEADKISEASFKKSSKLLTKQFIAVEDIICSKELDVVGKLGSSLGQKNQCFHEKGRKQSMTKPTSPSLPRVPGSRGPSVNGKHLRGFRRLKFMRPIPNCPHIEVSKNTLKM